MSIWKVIGDNAYDKRRSFLCTKWMEDYYNIISMLQFNSTFECCSGVVLCPTKKCCRPCWSSTLHSTFYTGIAMALWLAHYNGTNANKQATKTCVKIRGVVPRRRLGTHIGIALAMSQMPSAEDYHILNTLVIIYKCDGFLAEGFHYSFFKVYQTLS